MVAQVIGVPTVHDVGETIYREFDPLGTAPLSEAIEELLVRKYAMSTPAAAELGERKSQQIKSVLNGLMQAHREKGIEPNCHWSEINPEVLIGCSRVLPRDDPQTIEAKGLRAQLPRATRAMASDITPREFEILCGKLLQALGFRDIYVTPISKDEGVDFLGTLFLSPFAGTDNTGAAGPKLSLPIRLIGQAKRYANPVQVGHIREFFGASRIWLYSLLMGSAGGSIRGGVAAGSARLADPMVSMFVTTSTLTEEAERLAGNLGIVVRDGEQIANLLLSELRIAVLAKNGRHEFSLDEFRNWLSE